jgi:uncharacterized membrane protein YoaK (UPF0700 family)
MKQMLGGVIVGLLVAGVVAGAIVPVLPPSVRGPWAIWTVAAVAIAASVYVVRRVTKTPPS